MADSLKYSLENHVLRLTLFSPKRGNSFGPEEARALKEALNSGRSAHLLFFQSGSRRFFCSGGDLSFYSRLKTRRDGLRANRQIRLALQSLADFSAYKVALVDGDAWGGGLELLSCFDEIWASPRSLFGFWQRRLGLGFGWGGRQRMESRVSHRKLTSLGLRGRTLSAYEARSVGLIDRILPSELFDRECTEVEKETISLNARIADALRAGPKREERAFEALWLKKDHRAALTGFIEGQKRRGCR